MSKTQNLWNDAYELGKRDEKDRLSEKIRALLNCARRNHKQGHMSDDYFKGGETVLKLLLIHLGIFD